MTPSRIAIAVLIATMPSMLALAACSAAGDQHLFNTGDAGGSGGSASEQQGSGPGLTTGQSGAGGIDLGTGGAGTGTGGPSAMVGDPATCAEAAASHTYIGCDFWPTVVANNVWSIFDYAVVVANAGAQTASVTVSRNGQTLEKVAVAPNGLQTIYLPWVPELKGEDSNNCGVLVPLMASVSSTGGAYHLVTDSPVTVYQFNALEYQGKGGAPGKDWSSCPGNQICPISGMANGCYSFTNDASLLLPSTAMTGNYRVTSEKDWAAPSEGAYFAITATQANTMVTVYVAPGGHVVAGGNIPDTAGGGQINLTLNAGDVAELVSDGQSDITGSLVKASAPVQVISGMPCAFEPYNVQDPACDHLEESVFPAETLGKHYFVSPPTSPNGDVVGQVVRLVGNVDGTALTYPSGARPSMAPTTLDAGQVVDLGVVATSFEVAGNHEFAIVTFMLGGSLVDPNTSPNLRQGDPSQSEPTAVEQYRVKYVFLAPSDYTTSYVDIVQPMNADVTIDGAPSGVAPSAIGSNFGIARVKLGPGNNGAHVMTSTAPVGIQVIGYGQYTSYQYPGGSNLNAIAPPPKIPK